MARRLHDAAALVRVDAVDRGAQRAAASRAHLDDDELAVLTADEIELAETATITAREDREPVPLEVGRGARLPESAALEPHFSAGR